MSTRSWSIAIALLSASVPCASDAQLAPDDPSVRPGLVLWLHDADIDYDPAGGLWSDSSGRGHDATVAGPVGGVDYVAPGLQVIPPGGVVAGELSAVAFSGEVDDLLATPPLNGGAGLPELTLIAVYNVSELSGNPSLTRPVGFGSIAGTGTNPGDHFQFASDPSIRKDNGSVTGHSQELPTAVGFIRSARMSAAGGIDEWFNTGDGPEAVLADGGAAFTTSSDRLFLGDLRAGATAVPGFGTATAPSDFEIIEVLVYDNALGDDQIGAINEWLIRDLGGEAPPSILSFVAEPADISEGEFALISWEVEGASSVTISPGIGEVDAASGMILASPSSTITYVLQATGETGTSSAQVTVRVDAPAQEPFISEFLARNDNGLEDEDGDSSDWLEIHNPNAFGLPLGGYSITDDPNLLTKWRFPAGVELEAGGYLIVFASAKDRAVAGGELHTNFSLDGEGEYLALVAPDGEMVISEFAPLYPKQISDVSYGFDGGGNRLFFAPPSPGAANEAGFEGQVADTKFSVDRGFYDEAFELAITTATPGALIRFTTNGSAPTETHGAIYEGPITVDTTTVLRAAAFKDGLIASNVDTQSYLFLEDVIRQPAAPEGFPSTWGTRSPDYAMDQRVVDDPAYRDEIIAGLKSIRTLSLVVDQDDFFNNPNGIYANPRNDGRAWERAVSFEFIHPGAPGEDVQTDGGIRIHGNGSRSPGGQPKHGFRVEFRGVYGAKRLKYRLFSDLDIEEFDSFILRGQNAHGWTRSSQIGNSVGTTEREQSQYIRDSFARDLMKHMGQVSGEATYVHLYINGLYWGLYNPVEYPRSYFGASHFGGVEEDYDVINRRTTTTKILDGSFAAWNAMQDLANSGLETPEKYAQIAEHIDIDNLIDYMLTHQYMGSRDGPEVFNSNNMRAIRKARGEFSTPWICMPWDMEASMFEIDVTRNVNVDDPNTLVRVYTKLRENPEFRLRYADRVHRHCFNGGTLTPERTAEIWEARAREIETAIIGESARWGDYRRPAQPFTRDGEWQQERERLLTTYFPTRTDFLVALLRRNELYPEVDAPVFSQHGGAVPAGFVLTMDPTPGEIYYTLDGSDPRLEGGAINPAAISLGGGLTLDRFIDFESDRWRFLDNGADLGSSEIVLGQPAFGAGNWKHPEFDDNSWATGRAMFGYGGINGGTINQSVGFGGNSTNKYLTTYFRNGFNVENAANYTELRIAVKRDDGVIVYLNGLEAARSNMPDGEIVFDSVSASSVSGAAESASVEFVTPLPPGVLRDGENVVAVELHQSSASSSDLAMDLQLGGLAVRDGAGVHLDRSVAVRARVLHDGTWSALNEAIFLVGDLAAPGNVVVSEVHYNPSGAGEQLEFIELLNVSADPLDLSGVHFSGVDATVPTGTILAPGAYLLLVSDRAAFAAEYGAGLPVAAEFANDTALDNGGERLTLRAADGSVIESFRFDDTSPWPARPDGLGASLTRVLPMGVGDPGEAANWRASTPDGGSPGASDAVGFAGDPNADGDADGLSAWLEHSMGTREDTPDRRAGLFGAELAPDGGLTVFVQRNRAAEDAGLTIESSADLRTWREVTDSFARVAASSREGAVEIETYRSEAGAEPDEFVRIRFSRD